MLFTVVAALIGKPARGSAVLNVQCSTLNGRYRDGYGWTVRHQPRFSDKLQLKKEQLEFSVLGILIGGIGRN